MAFIVSLSGILEACEFFIGTALDYEEILVPPAGTLQGAPVARMSPATGFLFFLSGIIAICLTTQRREIERQAFADHLGGHLAIIVLMTSFAFSLAYFYGDPLLYGHGTIPMAMTTALGFLFLSISYITTEKQCFPIRLLTGTSTHSYLLRFILPLAMLSVLFGGLVFMLFEHIVIPVNPALVSAALTVLVAIAAVWVATWMSKVMGNEIDLVP